MNQIVGMLFDNKRLIGEGPAVYMEQLLSVTVFTSHQRYHIFLTWLFALPSPSVLLVLYSVKRSVSMIVANVRSLFYYIAFSLQ